MSLMTEEDIIDDVFKKEGDRYGDPETQPPIDQPTGRGGIVLDTLSEFRGVSATIDELKALSHAEARIIVRWKLRRLADVSGLDQITFEPLRLQLIDFAYNSGAPRAIRWLQRVLRVTADGVIGPDTIAAMIAADAWLVHHALIAARLQMIDLWSDAIMRRKQWEEGLEGRALSFSLLLA